MARRNEQGKRRRKKDENAKKYAFSDKRFFASCVSFRCGRKFETDDLIEVAETDSCPNCGTKITWNDSATLSSFSADSIPERVVRY